MALTEKQQHNAEIIASTARGLGLDRAAVVIGITVALAESDLINYANDGLSTLTGKFEHRQLNDAERAAARESLQFPNDGIPPWGCDLDSIGLFQQRPMTGWGPAGELIDPVKSTTRFYFGIGQNRGLTQIDGWPDMHPWNAAQAVQGSPVSDGGIYRDKYDQATDIVTALHLSDPSDNDFLEDIMANAVIYHAGFNGTMYEVNLLTGTYWAIQSEEQFVNRKYTLSKAGIPFENWPEPVNTLSGFGLPEA